MKTVRILPTPWVFDGAKISVLADERNRWSVTRRGRSLRLRNAETGQKFDLARARIHRREERDDLLLNAQAVIDRREVILKPLPKGYWDFS